MPGNSASDLAKTDLELIGKALALYKNAARLGRKMGVGTNTPNQWKAQAKQGKPLPADKRAHLALLLGAGAPTDADATSAALRGLPEEIKEASELMMRGHARLIAQFASSVWQAARHDQPESAEVAPTKTIRKTSRG